MTAAFDRLLATHYLRVHRAALGFMRDEQDARDTAQEALLKAHRARDRYDPNRPFYPWLYRIVRNTCFDALARRKHAAVSGLDTERVTGTQSDPAAAMDEARSIQRMKVAMGELSDEHREIINMRHFQDLSYAEIAQLLDLAEGTVMSRLYRARKALAREMNKGGAE